MKRLLLIGGGVAHAETLVSLAEASTRNADVTLLHPRRLMPWLPLAPGLVAGHHTHADAHYDLAALARRVKAKFIEEGVAAFDPVKRLAATTSGQVLEFDLASIDAGASSFDPAVGGLRQNALLARPLDVFLEGWERIVEMMKEGKLRTLNLVGGDAWSVELMLAMHHRLGRELDPELMRACGFAIVTPAARVLEDWPEEFSARVEDECFGCGISLMRGAAVTEVTRDGMQLANGARLASDVTIWARGSHAPRWLDTAGLERDATGRLEVDAQLRTARHPHVFAAGECVARPGAEAATTHAALLHEAGLLARNLQAACAAQPLGTREDVADGTRWFALGARAALGWQAGRMRERAPWWWWRRMVAAERKALRRYLVLKS